MKTTQSKSARLTVLIALAVGSFLFTACDLTGAATDAAGGVVSGGSSLSAQVDGKSWSSDLGAFYIPFGKGVSITGTSGMDQLLTLSMDSTAVGEYRVDGKTSFAIALEDGDDMYLARKGTIHITRSGADYIEGDFEGQLERDGDGVRKTVIISSGKFKAKPADKSLKFN